MFMKTFSSVVFFFGLLLTSFSSQATGTVADQILGKYKVVGRETAEIKAIVEARKDSTGKYYFKIVELNKNATGYQEVCTKCPGKFKNKPMVGTIVAWNVKPTGKKGKYAGAVGFDPWTGKRFQGKAKLSASKKVLYITAHPPETNMVSRKLRWLRVD